MKSPCKYPGCGTLLDSLGYCESHLSAKPNIRKDYDKRRSQSPALALAAKIRSSSRWQNVRREKISRHPLCQDPFGTHAMSKSTASSVDVHHIRGLATAPELAFASDNLMGVCKKCHAQLEALVTPPLSGGGLKL